MRKIDLDKPMSRKDYMIVWLLTFSIAIVFEAMGVICWNLVKIQSWSRDKIKEIKNTISWKRMEK